MTKKITFFALKLRINRAYVIFIDDNNQQDCLNDILNNLQILTINKFNIKKYQHIMLNEITDCHLTEQKIEIITSNIINKLIL